MTKQIVSSHSYHSSIKNMSNEVPVCAGGTSYTLASRLGHSLTKSEVCPNK